MNIGQGINSSSTQVLYDLWYMQGNQELLANWKISRDVHL